MSPTAQSLEKPTTSLEAAEVKEQSPADRNSKSSCPESKSQSHSRKLLLQMWLPPFTNASLSEAAVNFQDRERERE